MQIASTNLMPNFLAILEAAPLVATIAIAVTRHLLPVIDERKGRARAIALMETREPDWSLDILRHPLVTADLGDQAAVEALYLALRDGRMRIPSEITDYVIALIGMGRAIDCTCLPGYGSFYSKVRKTTRPSGTAQA